jgi:hypothetical protein
MSKTIHRGALITENGDVSALCFASPHPIDLKRSTWTLRDSAVTCKRCLVVMAAKKKDAPPCSSDHETIDKE